MINEDEFINEYAEILQKVKLENQIARENPDAALSSEALKLLLSKAIVELKPHIATDSRKATIYAKIMDLYCRLSGFTKQDIKILTGPEQWAKAVEDNNA